MHVYTFFFGKKIMIFIEKKRKNTWAFKKTKPTKMEELPLQDRTPTMQNHTSRIITKGLRNGS